MSRPPLQLGSWGRISTRVDKTDNKGKPTRYLSKANFRDHDGHVRDVTATGLNKTTAEAKLLKKLQDRANTSQSGELTALHKINHLLDLWKQRFETQIADGKRSPTSLDTYRRNLKNHVRPAIGELRIGEATTPCLDTILAKIKSTAGASTAKTGRAIISGAMKLAVRYGALTVNPVAKSTPSKPNPRIHPAPSPAKEVTLLRKNLSADETAVNADLPDLTAFMLGTGVRIGESLAVLWHQVDLEAGTVEITHTIARIKGEGLIRKRTKSKAGGRLLHLPNWAIATLRTRHAAGIRLDDPIFTDTTGGYREPSNTRRALRTALSPVGNIARRDLGLSLRTLRRETGMTRKQVADTVARPKPGSNSSKPAASRSTTN